MLRAPHPPPPHRTRVQLPRWQEPPNTRAHPLCLQAAREAANDRDTRHAIVLPICPIGRTKATANEKGAPERRNYTRERRGKGAGLIRGRQVERDAGLPPVVGELGPAVPAHRTLGLAFGCFLRETAPRLFGAAGEGGVPTRLPIASQRFWRSSRPKRQNAGTAGPCSRSSSSVSSRSASSPCRGGSRRPPGPASARG